MTISLSYSRFQKVRKRVSTIERFVQWFESGEWKLNESLLPVRYLLTKIDFWAVFKCSLALLCITIFSWKWHFPLWALLFISYFILFITDLYLIFGMDGKTVLTSLDVALCPNSVVHLLRHFFKIKIEFLCAEQNLRSWSRLMLEPFKKLLVRCPPLLPLASGARGKAMFWHSSVCLSTRGVPLPSPDGLCYGYEGGFSLHCCGPSPCVVIIVFFKKLLSPVFGSNPIKTVQKLLVCILQPCKPLTGGADSVVVARYWCLLWTPSSSVAVYMSWRVPTFLIWAQCTRRHPWTSAVTPERRGLNAPVANC